MTGRELSAEEKAFVIAVFGEWGMKYAGLAMDRIAPWDYELINIAPSLSSFKRISTIVPEGEMNIFSHAFENCDEDFLQNVSLVTNIASEYRFVSDIRLLSYLCAVSVGEKILRSTATRDKALSFNVVASSFNSLSPLISDGLVDHLGMPKGALFFLKEAYGEAQVFSYRKGDGEATIVLCNNSEKVLNGTLKWTLLDNNNTVLFGEAVEICLEPNSDSTVTTADLSEYIKVREEESYILCEITVGANTIARSVMLFSKTKYFKFKDPCISAKIAKSGKDYVITLSSDRFAHRVQLGFKNIDGSFSENYLDITSDSPRRVVFTPLCCTTEENLINELEIISMYDIR